MPKFTFGINEGGRARIECNYEDYKVWEKILFGVATEGTTLVEGGRYWKTLRFVVGKTEYRISGPVMTSREED